jgi:hypothetical protein
MNKMSNTFETYGQESNSNHTLRSVIRSDGKKISRNDNKAILDILTAEGREDFRRYIECTGIGRNQNVVVLSSLHNYFYDAEEMQNVNAVINLKEINQIKNIKNFLHSIFHILPQRSNFIGCFVDNEHSGNTEATNKLSDYQKNKNNQEIENGIASRFTFLNMVYNLMDSKTNKHLSKNNVEILLEGHGFKIRNMTEINGLTYFLAQKTSLAEGRPS